MKTYFLGIDGGGTRTTAWLADERGHVMARAVSGPSNPLKVGFEACERELLQAAGEAIAAVSGGREREFATLAAVSDRRQKRIANPATSPTGPEQGRRQQSAASNVSDRRYSRLPLEAVVVGLAGVDRPPVHARILAVLRKKIPARHHLLTSDAAIALYAAVGNTPAIIVISGTGSIAFARDPSGNVLRSGGWGTAYDDLGSGYEIGRRAIVAALRDYDGRGPRTSLGTKICRALKLRDITQIILKPLTPQDTAALSPLVLDAARRRDAVARHILDIAAHDLSDLTGALINRLGWRRREFPVVCSGGVFSSSARVRNVFALAVRNRAPRARVLLLRKPPVEGAVALARELGRGE